MLQARDVSARFAIDTGGTFTDIVVLDQATGQFRIEKTATTPQNTIQGVLAAITKAGVDLTNVDRFFVHGSTTALNALLEGKGVSTAFVTTKGFRDVPEIGRFNRPQMHDPKYHKPRQLVPRNFRFEITERINANGEILTALDLDEVRAVARRIRERGARSVAICFLHAHRNGAHEREVRTIFQQEMPEIAVAISSQVAPEHREYERSMTTILNAYLAPVVEKWISDLEAALHSRGFKGQILLTRSDGGGMTAAAAKDSPINMLLSGPAGGVIGGVYVAGISGHRNLITMDVGGTSFDVAVIRDGKASTQQHTSIEGYPALISNIDIRTIGAGGGSLAWVDSAGALHVGPQSAGAQPGPICYGRSGTRPTVTDAFLVNGFIDPKSFLGGQMMLDVQAASRGIDEVIAKPLGMSLMTASSGILRIATANMAEAVRSITAEAGDDPREFAMLCFGGGGALFGSFIMDELALPAAIIPIGSSAFSAWGMLMIDLRHDVVESFAVRLSCTTMGELSSRFDRLADRGMELLRAEGVSTESRQLEYSIDMRYAGQEHVVVVPVTRADLAADDEVGLTDSFEGVYKGVYGYSLGLPPELVNLRVKAIGKIPTPHFRETNGWRSARATARDIRRVCDFLNGQVLDWSVYHRDDLAPGMHLDGPALVEEATTTTVVRQGQSLTVDNLGNLVIKRIGALSNE